MFDSCCLAVFIRVLVFFVFKQKTAYEMRISDWSSDVCSSDLWEGIMLMQSTRIRSGINGCPLFGEHYESTSNAAEYSSSVLNGVLPNVVHDQIGRASCRERVCQYV